MSADVEPLVDRIYEAAAFSDEWPSVLHDLASKADAAVGAPVAFDVGEQIETGRFARLDRRAGW